MPDKRRLVICNDGTWNTPDDEDRGTRRPTNVTKISRAIRPQGVDGTNQITFYDEGVGTGWGDSLVGGATGIGLSQNVIDSYRFLSNNYQNGDELYIFGFSRGAYTSRSLCGLLNAVGLLEKKDNFYTPELYRFYKDGAGRKTVEDFLENRDLKIYHPRVKFIGVFDTVGALGIPISGINRLLEKFELVELSFHDVTLSNNVDYAYHALAIDERRKPFEPTLWSSAANETKEMEQRWFAGVHSNIGGGYKPDGLANLALQYIVRKARAVGLEFDDQYLEFFEGHYDSEIRDSMSAKYRLLGTVTRPVAPGSDTQEMVDESVYQRIAGDPTYRPPNVPDKS